MAFLYPMPRGLHAFPMVRNDVAAPMCTSMIEDD